MKSHSGDATARATISKTRYRQTMTTAVIGPFIVSTARAQLNARTVRWHSAFKITHADDLSETAMYDSHGADCLTPRSAERDAMELGTELAQTLIRHGLIGPSER